MFQSVVQASWIRAEQLHLSFDLKLLHIQIVLYQGSRGQEFHFQLKQQPLASLLPLKKCVVVACFLLGCHGVNFR
jgi:hypothetical protein